MWGNYIGRKYLSHLWVLCFTETPFVIELVPKSPNITKIELRSVFPWAMVCLTVYDIDLSHLGFSLTIKLLHFSYSLRLLPLFLKNHKLIAKKKQNISQIFFCKPDRENYFISKTIKNLSAALLMPQLLIPLLKYSAAQIFDATLIRLLYWLKHASALQSLFLFFSLSMWCF